MTLECWVFDKVKTILVASRTLIYLSTEAVNVKKVIEYQKTKQTMQIRE